MSNEKGKVHTKCPRCAERARRRQRAQQVGLATVRFLLHVTAIVIAEEVLRVFWHRIH